MKDYTTLEKIEKINKDKDISEEIKKQEAEKIEISNDSYAICDFLDKLNYKLDKLRLAYG